MSANLEIQIIAMIIAVACALPGNFLILRKMSMMTDSITHTILLGIVLGFFVAKDLNSPILMIGAVAMGVFTVWATEAVIKTKIVAEDSAIGIIFPLFFSLAIILLTKFAGNVHLDTKCVLLGELAFTPFDRMVMFGTDIGPKSMYMGMLLLVVNLLFIVILFKELKLSTFDPMLAAVFGFSPVILHYAFMTIISFTAVGAFESVGSILVIAFMIAPPAIAYLLTDRLHIMLMISAIVAILSSLIGFKVAFELDVSIAGSMAASLGVIFLIASIFAPQRGVITVILRRRKQRSSFEKIVVLRHIMNHEHTQRCKIENGITTIYDHLKWNKKYLDNIIGHLRKSNYIDEKDGMYIATEVGIEKCKEFYQSFAEVE